MALLDEYIAYLKTIFIYDNIYWEEEVDPDDGDSYIRVSIETYMDPERAVDLYDMIKFGDYDFEEIVVTCLDWM